MGGVCKSRAPPAPAPTHRGNLAVKEPFAGAPLLELQDLALDSVPGGNAQGDTGSIYAKLPQVTTCDSKSPRRYHSIYLQDLAGLLQHIDLRD